jgi:hypothetical protein
LVYHFNAANTLKAIEYANTVARGLRPIAGYEFSEQKAGVLVNETVRERVDAAFEALVTQELPAFITQTWIRSTSLSIKKRITETLSPHLRQMSEGLAELFCLTDPSREDNPMIFASEEFFRTTEYGKGHAIGRNCRFLQGPGTNPQSIARAKLMSGKERYETILNYRRDGPPLSTFSCVRPYSTAEA